MMHLGSSVRRSLIRTLAATVMLAPIASIAQQSVAVTTPPAKAPSADELLRKRITVQLDAVSLVQALRAIGRASGTQIAYEPPVVASVSGTVTLRTTATLQTVLDRVLAGTPLEYITAPNGQIAVVVRDAARDVARGAGMGVTTGIIVGKVVDAETGKPIAGASVSIANATKGVLTGEDGTYRITGLVAGTLTVRVRLVGYIKQSREIAVSDGASSSADFRMSRSTNTLDQVVVTGTVVATELKSVPTAITVITAKELEERNITHIDQLFRGDVPGLFAQNRGTYAPMGEVMMYSRGASAFNGGSSAGTDGWSSNPIKTYVDGVELSNPKYLSQIDPKTIERIEILAGPQASTIYGSNAINGVMQIFTKRGTTTKPQLTLNLLSGVIQNSFSTSRTPQHDYMAQLSGVEGRISYNAGAGWLYTAPWAPNAQTQSLRGFGGVHFDLPTSMGMVRTDMTIQRTSASNDARGTSDVLNGVLVGNGTFGKDQYNAAQQATPTRTALAMQTLGVTLGYSPTSWWSNDLVIGADNTKNDNFNLGYAYRSPTDTMSYIVSTYTDRRSLRFSSTVKIPLGSLVQANVSAGADEWQSLNWFGYSNSQTLTGPLGYNFVQRDPTHNTGAFIQSQIGVMDKLFLTYGLRTEWNPAYGNEVNPNHAPRFGAAYTQELGGVTAKLRASYGRSTRPPTTSATKGLIVDHYYQPFFGMIFAQLPNAELGPEFQRGAEGGLELYFGGRASLVVTRYNQTVEHLIANVYGADSVRSLMQDPYGDCVFNPLDCGYVYLQQSQNINLGTLRNQGWETQASITTGPFATRGTYSWTKSRVIGIDARYRMIFPPSSYPSYQPGATFQFLAEHTWALGTTYARGGTTVALNLNGTGQVSGYHNRTILLHTSYGIRLQPDNWRASQTSVLGMNPPYATADLNLSQRFTPTMEGLLSIQNLSNVYGSDAGYEYPVMGRQTKVGLRIRL